MNKKFISLLMAVVMAFSVVACGDADGENPTPTPTPVPQATATPQPTPTPMPQADDKEATGETDGKTDNTVNVEDVELGDVVKETEDTTTPAEHTHSFQMTNEYVVSYTDATCTDYGLVTFKCTGCNATISYHSNPYGHKYVRSSTKEATCTDKGEYVTVCTRCGDTYTETPDALGHKYDNGKTTNATCTDNAFKTYTCTVCGGTKVEEIPGSALGHEFTGKVTTVDATCTTDGSKTTQCTRCTEIEISTIPALGHTYYYAYKDEQYDTATCRVCSNPTDVAHNVNESGVCEYCQTTFAAKIGDVYYTNLADAIANAADGNTINLFTRSYTENVTLGGRITVKGAANLGSVFNNSYFDIDTSTSDKPVEVTIDGLSFTGNSKIKVGFISHHNGVGGSDVIPTSKLTITNCSANIKVPDKNSSPHVGTEKGQFIHLDANYTTKFDLTLTNNNFVNAHTISGEDAAPIINGNGTIIQNVVISNNTFGSANNPCYRYAVKFARRSNKCNITIENNTVHGATTSDKDFYILDLWQSGSNAQNNLAVKVNNNAVIGTPDTGRTMYTAYIESTVIGSDITIESTGNTLNGAENNVVNNKSVIK